MTTRTAEAGRAEFFERPRLTGVALLQFSNSSRHRVGVSQADGFSTAVLFFAFLRQPEWWLRGPQLGSPCGVWKGDFNFTFPNEFERDWTKDVRRLAIHPLRMAGRIRPNGPPASFCDPHGSGKMA